MEVTQAKYLEGYTLLLHFNDGEDRIADLFTSLRGEVFEPLKDKDFFRRFTIRFNTVEWENGADFAPEYLYDISTPLPEANTSTSYAEANVCEEQSLSVAEDEPPYGKNLKP